MNNDNNMNNNMGMNPDMSNNMNNNMGMNPNMNNNMNNNMGMNPDMSNNMNSNMGMNPNMNNNMNNNMGMNPNMNNNMNNNMGMNPNMNNNMNNNMGMEPTMNNNMNSNMGMNSNMNNNMGMNSDMNNNVNNNMGMNLGMNASPKAGGKKGLIILGVIIVVLIVGFIAKGMLGGSKKVLTCSSHVDMLGVVGDMEYKFYINDGKVAFDTILTYYLDQFSASKDAVTEWAEQRIKDDKADCKNTEGCTFKHEYKKNVLLKETLSISEKGFEKMAGSDISSYSADEIYNKLKNEYETGELLTCK